MDSLGHILVPVMEYNHIHVNFTKKPVENICANVTKCETVRRDFIRAKVVAHIITEIRQYKMLLTDFSMFIQFERDSLKISR